MVVAEAQNRKCSRALGDRISYDQKYDSIKVGFTPPWNGYEPVNVDRGYARGFPLHTYRARSHRFTSNSGSLRLFQPRARHVGSRILETPLLLPNGENRFLRGLCQGDVSYRLLRGLVVSVSSFSFAACFFAAKRFGNVARSAVVRQIDYVRARDILRMTRPRSPSFALVRPRSPFHTCYSRSHPRSRNTSYHRSRASPGAFFSIPSSLPGSSLQKLQRVSTKSTNHSIIKSVSALHAWGTAAMSPALKFTSRRNRRNDETGASSRYGLYVITLFTSCN